MWVLGGWGGQVTYVPTCCCQHNHYFRQQAIQKDKMWEERLWEVLVLSQVSTNFCKLKFGQTIDNYTSLNQSV